MKPDFNVLVIRTDFLHHGDNFGYKQILKFIRPVKTLGINERSSEKVSSLKQKYQWLFEWDAFRFRKKIDLVHILYGEDYYRWSGYLFRKIPVVATFHQPAEVLEREVVKGDLRGRVGRMTHVLTPGRFKRLDAAIVTNASQIAVLEKVMPREKIHHIPLGIHIEQLNDKFQNRAGIAKEATKNIITVGNWMRDWDFYIEVVKRCPDLTFHLVDRKISRPLLGIISQLKNVIYYPNIWDQDLFDLYLKADLQFLPVLGIAGSNAFLQGLALGCPTLVTGFDNDQEEPGATFILRYRKDDVDDCIQKMNMLIAMSPGEKDALKKSANAYANQFSWPSIAQKTMELYKQVISKKQY